MVQRNHSWERQSVGFKLQFWCQTPAEMLEERMANTSSRQRQTTTSSNYQIRYFWHDCCRLWYMVVIQYRCCKIFLLCLFDHFKLNEVDMTGMERRKTSIDRKQNTTIVSYYILFRILPQLVRPYAPIRVPTSKCRYDFEVYVDPENRQPWSRRFSCPFFAYTFVGTSDLTFRLTLQKILGQQISGFSGVIERPATTKSPAFWIADMVPEVAF